MAIGDLIAPRYRLTGTLADGQGGQKYFYIAEDTFLGRKIAIKVPKDKASLATLQKEITKMSLVSSKHVVRCLDQIKDRGIPIALVEEYVSGKTLKETDLKALSLDSILRILYQISQGLAHIHSAGLVHRDITPSNIKIDDEGVVKILDFGIASFTVDDQTEIGRGTFAFKAPEVFTRPMQPTSAVDVYSFGVIAHLLLSRGTLCDQFVRGALRQKIAPPPPFTAFSELDGDQMLTDLLEDCISHDVVSRPSILELRDVIQARLARNKHAALLTSSSLQDSLVIDSSKKKAIIRFPAQPHPLEIHYDGLEFALVSQPNESYVNGAAVRTPFVLQRSCVITVGAPSKGSARHFITFDVSQPEIVI